MTASDLLAAAIELDIAVERGTALQLAKALKKMKRVTRACELAGTILPKKINNRSKRIIKS
jgi:hypothetical protein